MSPAHFAHGTASGVTLIGAGSGSHKGLQTPRPCEYEAYQVALPGKRINCHSWWRTGLALASMSNAVHTAKCWRSMCPMMVPPRSFFFSRGQPRYVNLRQLVSSRSMMLAVLLISRRTPICFNWTHRRAHGNFSDGGKSCFKVTRLGLDASDCNSVDRGCSRQWWDSAACNW